VPRSCEYIYFQVAISQRAVFVERVFLLLKKKKQILTKLEKAIGASQANQMKALEAEFEKDKVDVRKKISINRRSEIKSLTQKHKDKDELNRYEEKNLNNYEKSVQNLG
jgi:hypothetical protein